MLCNRCGTTNREGRKFCAGCGAALSIACPACTSPNEPGERFCGDCGTALGPVVTESDPGQSATEERRLVTVLFADLSGFTAFSERSDPEEVRQLADEAAGRLGEIVHRYGGTVDKIIGDCVMAVFGAPDSHEDDPERAVRAAIDMQQYVREHRDKFAGLPLRIGVNTGETIYAPVGPGGQHTVLGDTVNTAARLQSGAAKGETLIGEPTFAAVARSIDLEPVPPLTAKGKEEPVPAWRAVAVKGAPPEKATTSAPLIGRGQEFGRLWELWERALTERRPYLATLLGIPGIGKSRLLGEFATRVEDTASVYTGRCLSYGEGITYWPLIEMVRDAAGILHTDDPASMSSKLGGFLERLGIDDRDQLRTMASALAILVEVPVTPRGTYSVGEITQAELHWGVRRVFQLLSGQHPIVLVFEDLHWAEPTLLELLAYLLDTDDAPMLLLGSARPELKDSGAGIMTASWNRRVIELEALAAEESKALLGELVGMVELSDEQAAALLHAAGGNPLFLEETVRMLADSALAGESEPERVVPVPQSLQSLLGSRLDQLNDTERRLALHASVVGQVFWPGAIRHLESTADDIDLGLEALEVRDFVHEHESSSVAGEREFAFKHALVRDVAYSRLPKAQRAELHIRCAEWIDALPGPADEFIEIVAYHLQESCSLARQLKRTAITPPVRRAAEALKRAAQKAERREGVREADRFYARALDVVGAEHQELATELRLRRGATLVALGDLTEARTELTEVASKAEALGDPDIHCDALLWLTYVEWQQGRYGEAKRSMGEAEPLVPLVRDRRLEVRAHFELAALVAWAEGDNDAARQHLRSALHLADEIEDRGLRIEGHMRLGALLFNVGELAEAEGEFAEAVRVAGELGSHRDEARSISMLGFVKYYRGDVDEAERLAQRALEWRERGSDSHLEVQNMRALAKYALARGNPKEAERLLLEVLPLATETGGWMVGEVYLYLTRALVELGELGRAEEALAAAGTSIPDEDAYALAAVWLAEASLATARGDEKVARKRYEAALEALAKQQLLTDEGETRVEYARALRRFGDDDGSRAQLQTAREIFTRCGASGLLEQLDLSA
ncbi:MAG: adenylate/guanylate cyclase domain-containing protein [Actinomycetota bacterium]